MSLLDMIDIHCHLTYPGLREKAREAIEEAIGVLVAIITCGLPFDREREEDFMSVKRVFRYAEEFPGFIYVTLGLHPTQSIEMLDDEVNAYKRLIAENRDRIVGIGEIGLDEFWLHDRSDIKRSEEVFREILELAQKLRKPVVIHSRKADEKAFLIVKEYNIGKVLFHSYTGNMTTAKKILEEGYFFSINYKVTNTKTMRKIAKKFPLEKILTETDAPFISPTGEVNKPVNVRYVIEAVARLRNMSFSEVDRITTFNAVKFFDLDEKLISNY